MQSILLLSSSYLIIHQLDKKEREKEIKEIREKRKDNYTGIRIHSFFSQQHTIK
jgi:hypothetical protein